MTGIRLPALGLAVAAALGAGVATAQSDSLARGRAVFDKKGCQYCHSYVSRRAAPAVRDMLREFEGDPQRVLKGIAAAPQHREVLSGGKVGDADQRLIAEWLGADFLPEDESGDESAPSPVAAVAAVAATAVRPAQAAAAVAPALPAGSARDVTDAAAPAIVGPAISAVRLQASGSAGSERLVVELRGGEPDGVDMSLIDNRLVMRFSGAALGSVPPRVVADPSFKVIESVGATTEGRTVTITVVPRDVAWTYSGMQGRNRMVIDFAVQSKVAAQVAKTPAATQPVQKSGAARPAAGPGVSSGAVAAGSVVAGAAAAAVKPTVQPTSKPTTRPTAVPSKPSEPKQAEPQQAAKMPADRARSQELASATAPARDSEAAKAREAEKAREQAEAAARAKAADEAARKREQERAAELAKAPAAVVAKVEPKADEAFGDSDAGSAGKRKVSKRPYKEPNLAPCPPPNPADQVIGVVDVERAKEIIDRIGCPQCHAYVQKKTGPPMREVIKKYKGDPACVIHRLKTNETHKDEGVTADIRPDEFKILADYVATRLK